MKKKTGLKAIMKEIIGKKVKEDVQAITRDMAKDHDVRITQGSIDNIKLTYDEICICWAFEVNIYIGVDTHYTCLRVEGLLHDSGAISVMAIYDRYSDRRVWDRYDDDGADPTRQMVYETLVA